MARAGESWQLYLLLARHGHVHRSGWSSQSGICAEAVLENPDILASRRLACTSVG